MNKDFNVFFMFYVLKIFEKGIGKYSTGSL